MLEALTGAFAETRRVIMVEVMAAIFLCVCCLSDATNDANTHRLRVKSEKRRSQTRHSFLWIRDPGRLTREKQTLVFEKGGMSGRKKKKKRGK